MKILIWEIANGINILSGMHDQRKPAKKYKSYSQYRRLRPPLVSSIPLVFLGRLVLVVHLALIGCDIGYLPNQDLMAILDS